MIPLPKMSPRYHFKPWWWCLKIDLLMLACRIPVLRLIRSRRSCPNCKGIGTWKCYGGPFRPKIDQKPGPSRRWLCKYCGKYDGEDYGESWAFADRDRGCWTVRELYGPSSSFGLISKNMESGRCMTPKGVLAKDYNVNPWAG